jgi:hypothetical protein
MYPQNDAVCFTAAALLFRLVLNPPLALLPVHGLVSSRCALHLSDGLLSILARARDVGNGCGARVWRCGLPGHRFGLTCAVGLRRTAIGLLA